MAEAKALGKAAITTPLYISVAWTLMVSYQLFTQIAVTTVISYINVIWPSVAVWLSSRVDVLVFIYAFAWVFVLSSAIPSVLLGKERSVLVQFFVCLTLTFVAFVIQDTLLMYNEEVSSHVFTIATLFHNPFIATAYLLMPYIMMLAIDIRSRRKRKKQENLQKVTAAYLENAAAEEQKIQEQQC